MINNSQNSQDHEKKNSLRSFQTRGDNEDMITKCNMVTWSDSWALKDTYRKTVNSLDFFIN